MAQTHQRTSRFRKLGLSVLVAVVGGLAAPIAQAQDANIPALKIRIANSYAKDQSAGVALDHFAKRVSELSGGKITAQVFHSGTLYSEDKSIQAVVDGTVDMGLASGSNHGPFTKVWRVIEAPYLFENRKQFREVLINGPIGDELRKAAEKDRLKPLMILETGGFRILGTNRLVKTPADLTNLKIRVPQSPVPLTFWKVAGANPTVIAWNETYLALGSHTVDGLDAAWTSWPLGKLWEVTKFITDVKYSSVASIVDTSTDWWEKRTPAQKEIILKAAKEAEAVSIREEDAAEVTIKDAIRKNGMTIYEPTAAEMEQWTKLGRGIWADIPDVPKDLLERVQAAVK